VRVWGDYHFADHFRVVAGLDDIFNEPAPFGANQQTLEQNFTGFSPFLSIGFIFTDEDLKGLLTATGIPAVP
jgi:hypothetical protein